MRTIAGYERYDGRRGPDAAPVPGVGPVLGVRCFRGIVFTIRSDGENPVLYCESEFGWRKVVPIWEAVL